jgi:hypothetical protein
MSSKRDVTIHFSFTLPASLRRRHLVLAAAAVLAVSVGAYAMTAVPHTFVAGQAVSAAQMNENFAALQQSLEAARWQAAHIAGAAACNAFLPPEGAGQNSYAANWLIARPAGVKCDDACAMRRSGDKCSNAVYIANPMAGPASGPMDVLASHFRYACDDGSNPPVESASPGGSYCCCYAPK